MSALPVNPEIIDWAIQRSGLDDIELLSKFPKLSKWKSGDASPTLKQLERFAKTTMTPLGALFLESPPNEELGIPDFRTKGNAPLRRISPNLIDTIQCIQNRQSWLREWVSYEHRDRVQIVGSATTENDPLKLAKKIREDLHLDSEWADQISTWENALRFLREKVESVGIFVFSNSVVGQNSHRRLDPEEFRGFVFSDPIAPVVFINDADTKSARIFTLIHEVVHVWIGKNALFNLENLQPSTDKTEKFCNAVAAEVLVPQDDFVQHWKSTSEDFDSKFKRFSKVFKVSPLVIARRALDFSYVSKKVFTNFYNQQTAEWKLLKEQRKESTGGNFYTTQRARLGKLFSSSIVRAVQEGRISYREAYQLTDLTGKTFQTFASSITKNAGE